MAQTPRPGRPPVSPAEADRLRELQQYEVLDTAPEPAFDDLTLLAAYVCGTPTALLSLVDKRRQWFKARVGFADEETSRDISFCAHAIMDPNDVMIVPDASKDPRFSQNPLVTGTDGIRFYAGAPLVTPSGHALGTLCVLDRMPRRLTPAQEEALRALARQAVVLLELRSLLHSLRARARRRTAKPRASRGRVRGRTPQKVEDLARRMARIQAILDEPSNLALAIKEPG